MSNYKQFDKFSIWIKQFAAQALIGNEGEVETKFVLPLFNSLGYPEECRRDKFYVQPYSELVEASDDKLAKESRAYADFVYFSTMVRDEQSRDTALVVIEVKKAGEDIDKHLAQALKYAERLHPLFVILTNGSRLKALRLLHGRVEEPVVDLLVSGLTDNSESLRFFERMNYETVSNVKRLTASSFGYDQFILLDRVINADPRLQEFLREGDFKPELIENEDGVLITKGRCCINSYGDRSAGNLDV
jgi:hypothetical protein